MNNNEILKEIERLNNIAYKLQYTNKTKAIECLFKIQELIVLAN